MAPDSNLRGPPERREHTIERGARDPNAWDLVQLARATYTHAPGSSDEGDSFGS